MDFQIGLTEAGPDMVIENGDIASDLGLRTPVLVSLYSEGRVDQPEDIPYPETDPRGWWADIFLRTRMGSLLWTLARAKITPETRSQARVIVEDALDWLLQDDLIGDLTVLVTQRNKDSLLVRIEMSRGTARKGSDLWESLLSDPVTFETPRLQVQILTT